MTSDDFRAIEKLFVENANSVRSVQMEAYLKNKFTLLGISATERKVLLKSIFHGMNWTRDEVLDFSQFCWQSTYREFQHAGLDILNKQSSLLNVEDIPFLENLVISKSWWDTVDGLAVNPIGRVLKNNKSIKYEWVRKWANSENMWLRRTAILHQLKYKNEVDVKLMEFTLEQANGTKEFFLNKAIGWMLREYAKTSPEYVINYCNEHKISNLSRREALKHLS